VPQWERSSRLLSFVVLVHSRTFVYWKQAR
jgi:hypothetical protein